MSRWPPASALTAQRRPAAAPRAHPCPAAVAIAATKANPFGDESLSKAGVRAQLETSLAAMQKESCEIFYLHAPDPDVSSKLSPHHADPSWFQLIVLSFLPLPLFPFPFVLTLLLRAGRDRGDFV